MSIAKLANTPLSSSTKLTITFPPEQKDALLGAVYSAASLSFEESNVEDRVAGYRECLSFYFDNQDAATCYLEQLKSILKERNLSFDFSTQYLEILDKQWESAWKEGITSQVIGRTLFIKPSWIDEPCPANRTLISLDPGMAFGSGSHETTTLCLEALEEISSSEALKSLLDVGSGSGILSITAALLGAKRVLGVDIDAGSVECAESNAQLNDCQVCQFRLAPIFEVAEKFDVVVANIISGTLKGIFPELFARVNPQGYLLLSGILLEEETTFLKDISLVPSRVVRGKEWLMLEFRNGNFSES